MKVICIARRGETLPEEYLDSRLPRTRETDFHLTVGKEYVVYAIGVSAEQVWYYIVDDGNLWFPLKKPSPLFNVINSGVSQYWHFRLTPGNRDHNVLIAFEEWVSDERFYERLTDKEQAEWKVFKRRKEQMDAESADNADVVPQQNHP